MTKAYIFFFLLFFNGIYCETSPIAIYLTWKDDPTSSMVIQWITNTSDQTSQVRYAKETDPPSSWESSYGIEIPFPEHQPYIYHAVFLSHLQSDTTYRFCIDGYSILHRFTTMPQKLLSPISFIVGGDVNLSNPEIFDQTTKEAIAHTPRFIAIGGDLACAASKKHTTERCDKWITFLQHWYKASISKNNNLTPLIVAIGNHEVKGKIGQTYEEAPFFYRLFATPGLQGYHCLRFGSYLSFYILDSGLTHPIEGPQSTWLSKQMENDKNILHKMALYHLPAYPNVRQYRCAEFNAVRKYFVPIFDKYSLHIAFENHEHAYKRTFPLMNHTHNPDGTIYIGNGSWGVHPRKPKTPSQTTYLEKAIPARAFTHITLSQHKRILSSITYTGEIIDSFEQDIDSIKILKLIAKEKELVTKHHQRMAK